MEHLLKFISSYGIVSGIGLSGNIDSLEGPHANPFFPGNCIESRLDIHN